MPLPGLHKPVSCGLCRYEDKVYWEVEDGEESDDEEHPVTGTPVASRGGAVVTASEMVSLTVSGEDNMSGVKGR